MSYTEKIDVLDLLIKILSEHEERIDELVSRLEAVADRLGVSTPDAELSRRFYEPL